MWIVVVAVCVCLCVCSCSNCHNFFYWINKQDKKKVDDNHVFFSFYCYILNSANFISFHFHFQFTNVAVVVVVLSTLFSPLFLDQLRHRQPTINNVKIDIVTSLKKKFFHHHHHQFKYWSLTIIFFSLFSCCY